MENSMKTQYVQVYKRLEELPVLMAQKEKKILELRQNIVQANYKLSKRESGIKYNISIKTDSEGKKLFTNEQQRNSAFYNESEKDEQYQGLQTEAQVLQDQKDLEEIEYRQLNNEFSSLKYMIKVLIMDKETDLDEELVHKEREIKRLIETIKHLKENEIGEEVTQKGSSEKDTFN